MPNPLKIAIAADGRPNYQVAAAACINPSALSKIIAGKARPTEPVMHRLAETLGKAVSELFPDHPTAQSVADERESQGLPPTVEDAGALAAVSSALHRPGEISGDAA